MDVLEIGIEAVDRLQGHGSVGHARAPRLLGHRFARAGGHAHEPREVAARRDGPRERIGAAQHLEPARLAVDRQRVRVGAREQRAVLLLRVLADGLDELAEDATAAVGMRHEGVGELVSQTLFPAPVEPERDRRAHAGERPALVERGEDERLPVGIAGVEPLRLRERPLPRVMRVVEVVEQRQLGHGEPPVGVARQPRGGGGRRRRGKA